MNNYYNKSLHVVYVSFAFLFYIYNTSLPLTLIPIAGHDDGLFMNLASQLARGHWLGGFSQFTLMKGAGFPIVLTLLYWLKIPVTIFYSLLIIGVCDYLRRSIIKAFDNKTVAVIVALVIMWYPGMDPTRILREPFMSWLVVMALAMCISFYANLKKEHRLDSKLLFTMGLLLGWVCITREEWATVVIPILLIPTSLIYFSQFLDKSYTLGIKNKIVGFFCLCIALPTIIVSCTNYMAYGSYISNDFKEQNFVESMKLLQSIRSSKKINEGILPVPEDVRLELYSLSPTFHALKKYFDEKDAPLLGWQQPSCNQFPETCGDYGGNWFFWALRDAVALNGNYESPKKAADFYSKLNAEIRSLCQSNRLVCDTKITAIPNLKENQVRHIFTLMKLSFDKITLISPPELYNMPSMGNPAQLETAAEFLHLSHFYPGATEKNLIENSKINTDLENHRNSSFKIKKFIIWIYSKICFAIAILGFVFFILFVLNQKSQKTNIFFLSVLWLLVIIRISLISIATETTFALVNHQYLAFAGPLLLLASFLSMLFLKDSICSHNKVKN